MHRGFSWSAHFFASLLAIPCSAFLCSATKQIVQIKQMCALLAERHGAELSECRSGFTPRSQDAESRNKPTPTRNHFYRLPTWSELARIPESDLRACLLGFRARYIAATAQYIAARPGWLEDTERLPYAEAKPVCWNSPVWAKKLLTAFCFSEPVNSKRFQWTPGCSNRSPVVTVWTIGHRPKSRILGALISVRSGWPRSSNIFSLGNGNSVGGNLWERDNSFYTKAAKIAKQV